MCLKIRLCLSLYHSASKIYIKCRLSIFEIYLYSFYLKDRSADKTKVLSPVYTLPLSRSLSLTLFFPNRIIRKIEFQFHLLFWSFADQVNLVMPNYEVVYTKVQIGTSFRFFFVFRFIIPCRNFKVVLKQVSLLLLQIYRYSKVSN